MAISSENTARILTRGETANFKVSFFADAAKTQPLTPLNVNYPQYTIYDTEGSPIQTGIGTMTSSGYYVANFLIPQDAKLSYFNQTPHRHDDANQGMDLTANQNRYRIEWVLVSEDNIQANFVEEFDVRDVAVTQSQSRELKYLTLCGQPTRVMYRTTVLPYKTNLNVYYRGGDQNAVVSETLDLSTPTPTGNIKYAKDGDSYVLYFDIAANVLLANTGYMVMWNVQETQFSVPTNEYQVLTSISSSVFPLIASLRMLIDKFQKRVGRLQAYEDSDLLEYLAQGIRAVNLHYPTTGYSISTMPDDLLYFAVLAAGWYGLNAQSILNAELNFNFSGQNVTLSVDNASQLDSIASKLQDEFNSKIGEAKLAYVRRERGLGTVGTRGIGYNRINSMVFKVASGNAGNIYNWLARIGLL